MNTTNDDPTSQPPIGFLLRNLDRLINERFELTLGNSDVTRRQWQLLNTVAACPSSVESLNAAVAPFLDRATGENAGQHLDPLVRQGFIRYADGVYALTDSGRELFARLADEVRTTRELTVSGLAEGEYERIVAGLSTMIRNLEPSD